MSWPWTTSVAGWGLPNSVTYFDPFEAIGAGAGWKTPHQLVNESAANSEKVSQHAYGMPIPIFRGSAKQIGRPVYAANITVKKSGGGENLRVGWDGFTFYWYYETEPEVYTYYGSIVVCFGRNAFNRPMTCLKIYANDDLIYASLGNGTPVKNKKMSIRLYDGIDNVVDPYLETIFGVGTTPSYEGYVVAVIEKMTLPGGYYPVIRGQWSDDADVQDLSQQLTTPYPINFSDPGFIVVATSYDPVLHRVIQMYDGANKDIGVVDLSAMAELSRTACDDPLFTFIAVLPGSDYVIGVTTAGNLLMVTNVFTGESFTGAATTSYYPTVALPYFGGGSSKYIALVKDDDGGVYAWKLAIIDLSESDIVSIDIPLPALVSETRCCMGAPLSSHCQFFVCDQNRIFEITYTTGVLNFTLVIDLDDATKTITSVAYDSRDPGVIFSYNKSADTYIAKTDLSGAILWDSLFSTLADYQVRDGQSIFHASADRDSWCRLRPGFAFILRSGTDGGGTINFFIIDGNDGSTEDIGRTVRDRAVYDHFSGLFYYFGGDTTAEYYVPPVPFWTRAGGSTTLGNIPISEVLEDFTTYGGRLTSAQISFSGLSTYFCKGFNFSQDFALGDTIRSICEVYSISMVESDGGIKYIRKAQNELLVLDKTLAASDFAEQTADDISASLASRRVFQIDVPSRVEIQYIDADRDFNSGSVHHERPLGVFDTTVSSRHETLSLPLIISAGDAKVYCIEKLYGYVVNQGVHSFIVPPDYAYLEPSDLLQIPAATGNVIVQIKTASMREDHSQSIDAVEFLTDSTTSSGSGTGLIDPGDQDPFGLSRYVHLDLPLLSYPNDTGGKFLVQYHLMSGRGQPVWKGAHLFRSSSGANFVEVDRASGEYPLIGIALNSIGNPEVFFSTDYVNTLNVRIIAGDTDDLGASTTYLDVMNGTNLFAYGKPGRWELMEYQTKTEEADGTFTFSILQRGLRGTEVYCNTHQTGDLFVPLRGGQVSLLEYNISDLNDFYYFKAVGNPDYPLAPVEYNEISGAAERCFAPCHLDATINGSDIDLTWIRRTRLEGRWADNGSTIPLGEATESYDIVIMDGSTVKRTFSAVATETKKYLAADIATDWGSMPATLKWRAFQNSAVTGRGHQAEVTSTLS